MVEDEPAFRVLGPLEIWAGARRLETRAPRQKAMLALLLLEPNRPVSKGQLIDTLWPGMPPAAATEVLHSLVYRLRRQLGPHETALGATLEYATNGYILQVAESSVDLYRFHRLVEEGRRALENGDRRAAVSRMRAGLGLWRGEAFADIEAVAIRDRAALLNDLRLDVIESCLRTELELGRHDGLLAELEGLTTEHPYRERLWELLMTALYRCGRQADALGAYQRLYHLLDEELGVQPGPAVRQLQQNILLGKAELAPPTTRTTPSSPVPRLLPAGIHDFTGRVPELKALDSLLPDKQDPDVSSAIALITGTGGIGKTVLAVQWAHRVSERFPHGQLYINLRGFDPSGQPVHPSGPIRLFLDALGVPAKRIPVNLDAQSGLFRSLVAEKRMLVLLDNAADEEQVRPLLPASSGCLTLVTSRNQLSGLVVRNMAYPVNLGPFAPTEAHEMLRHRLGNERVAAEPQAVQDISSSCAGLPLALAIAAARAAERSDASLATISAPLLQARSRLDALAVADDATDPRAVFSWSYHVLSSTSAYVFRLLGLHPGPHISSFAAASLAGIPRRQIQPVLAELTRAHLVNEEHPDRYTMHDLLRAYAAELVRDDDTNVRRQATTRMLDHYLHTAYAAALLISPHREQPTLGRTPTGTQPEQIADDKAALRWLDTERSVLLGLVALSIEAGMYTHTRQLAWTLADFDERQGHWHDKGIAGRLALSAAQAAGDKDAQARAHRSLARVCIRLRDLEAARIHCQRAFDVSAELGDRAGQGGALQNLAMVLGLENRHADALGYERRAVELFRAAGQRHAEAAALNAVGWRLAMLGEYDNALEPCRQALDLQQQLGDRYNEPDTWDSLGYIHHHQRDYGRAISCYQRALDLYEQLDNRYSIADTLVHLGETLRAVAGPPAGQHEWQRALDIFEDLGHPDADAVRAKLDADAGRR